jgi:hypothetical protein
MSSATSTSAADNVRSVRLESDDHRLHSAQNDRRRLQPNNTGGRQSDQTFRTSHFFILASLIAATGAVIISRESTPEHLVLISITIAAAGLAAAGFYRMLAPLVGESEQTTTEPLSQRARSVLEREKTLVLRSLKDLEFDRAMGKLSSGDFDDMAARLRARALALMKQLDEDGSGYRSIIERELSARLAARAVERHAKPQPAPQEAASVAVAGLCGCGTANDADAVYCKRCGIKLAATLPATERPQ